ncbi:MAG: methyl-accepting chemotaxis protein [Ramlibacter sp.]
MTAHPINRLSSRNVIGRLLAASFAVLVVLALIGAVLGSAALIRVDAATTAAVEQNLAAERLASEVRRLVAINAERYKAMALSSEPQVQDALSGDVRTAERNYRGLLVQLRLLSTEPQARQRLEEVRAADAAFQKAADGLRTAIGTNFSASIEKEYAQRFLPAATVMLDAVDRLANAQRLAIDAAAAEIHAQSVEARWFLLAFAGAALVLSALMARWLTRRISHPIAHASATASRVADLDLAHDIQGHGRDEAGRLLDALGRMQQNLRELVLEVSGSARNLHLAAGEMAQGNQDLSQRTEETASSLDGTAAALEQITRNLQDSSRGLADAKELAAQAAAQAVDGGNLVGELVERMHGIAQDSSRVTEIVSLIDSIAFQTNLLALNAAVEAARAGDYGRGFAVVAGEVRHLSRRTAEAARDVKVLVSESMRSIDEGALLAGRAGEVVTGVVEAMQGVAANIGKVALRTQAQGSDISDVNVAVARVSEATQQNAALVEQSSAASHRLREQAEALSALISRFVLPGGDAEAVPPRLLMRPDPS